MSDLSKTGHPAMAATFVPGKLKLGIIAPIEAHPGQPAPTMAEHTQLARFAEDVGVRTLWLRDVPFYDPSFGDAAQVFDPLVYAGWIGQATSKLVVGTAGIVAPLRNAHFVAKQVLTLDRLLGGRFLLGLASGDRPKEYPAMGIDFETRQARFRDAFEVIRTLTRRSFPTLRTAHFGDLTGGLEMLPRPENGQIPIVIIGRAGQTLDWIAQNGDAWIWHGPQAQRPDRIMPVWKEAAGDGLPPPYGYGTQFELDADADAPLMPGRVLRGGWKAMLEHFKVQEEQGLSHAALNLSQARRPAKNILEELGRHILPEFAG